MKILMFGMSSYPGGIENYIVNYFCNEQFSSENKIDFVIYENDIAYKEKILECGYGIKYVPHLKKNPMGYYRSVNKILKNGKYDGIYVNMLTAANVLPIFLSIRNKIFKIILHAHANSTVQGGVRRTLHLINKKYCQSKATLCLACSQEAGKWLFDKRRFYVVPNAVDCSKFKFSLEFRKEIRASLKIEEDEYVIGHVGRVAEEKNHKFMLEVLKEILKIDSKVKMIFVGEGNLKGQIKEKVKELQLDKNVIFYGVSNETYKIYSAFDCFLFPSIFEGFGMAALEAQSCGLKCYCSSQLPKTLNVTGDVKYINLNAGARKWAQIVVENVKEKSDSEEMNKKVLESDYNIKKQRIKVMRLLYANGK